MLEDEAAAAVHEATGTFVVVFGVGQVVVVQLLEDDAAAAVHEATGTLVVLFDVHTTWTPDPLTPTGVHVETAAELVVSQLQVVVV